MWFLRYYQAVRNQLTYDKDPDIRQTSWPKAAGTKLATGSTGQSEGVPNPVRGSLPANDLKFIFCSSARAELLKV